MEYYLVMKKNKVLPFANNVDGLGGYYAKPSKSDRERQIYMTYTESKKIKQTSEKNKKKLTHKLTNVENICDYHWGEEKG